MRSRRLLSLATALGLATMLTVPTGALAHDVAETMVRFNGNYLMVSVGLNGPVTEVRLDVYQGKIGRVKESTLVTAGVYSSGWAADDEELGTCQVQRTEWIGQYSPPNPNGTAPGLYLPPRLTGGRAVPPPLPSREGLGEGQDSSERTSSLVAHRRRSSFARRGSRGASVLMKSVSG